MCLILIQMKICPVKQNIICPLKEKIFHFLWFYNMRSMPNLPDLEVTFSKKIKFSKLIYNFWNHFSRGNLHVDFKYDITLTEFLIFLNDVNQDYFYSHLVYYGIVFLISALENSEWLPRAGICYYLEISWKYGNIILY